MRLNHSPLAFGCRTSYSYALWRYALLWQAVFLQLLCGKDGSSRDMYGTNRQVRGCSVGLRGVDGLLEVLFYSSTASLVLASVGLNVVRVALMVYAQQSQTSTSGYCLPLQAVRQYLKIAMKSLQPDIFILLLHKDTSRFSA